MAGWISAVVAFLAIAGQLVNVYLNLKLRNSVLESETRILSEVALTYKRKDVCAAEMSALVRESS